MKWGLSVVVWRRHIKDPRAASSNPFWVRIMVSKCIHNISPHAKDLHLSTTNWTAPLSWHQKLQAFSTVEETQKTTQLEQIWPTPCGHRPDPTITRPVCNIFILVLCLFGYLWPQWTSTPAPTSTPSTGCPLLLSCGWTSSTELIFGFTLVTNSVGNRTCI